MALWMRGRTALTIASLKSGTVARWAEMLHNISGVSRAARRCEGVGFLVIIVDNKSVPVVVLAKSASAVINVSVTAGTLISHVVDG